jgi:hypothetical protein
MDTFSLLFSAPSPKVEKTIEVNLEDLEQFFNTMDPSPFHEKGPGPPLGRIHR